VLLNLQIGNKCIARVVFESKVQWAATGGQRGSVDSLGFETLKGSVNQALKIPQNQNYSKNLVTKGN
jgi:hypothetical protein